MAYLLHIESTSTVCSVSISKDAELLTLKELNNGYTHAENLHVFIEHALIETNLKASDLNAISVSSGPGSYTGLRIGFSAAKGLAFALNIPLITIDTLKALSVSAIRQIKEEAVFIPMMDARRMEVYCAAYDHNLKEILQVQALVLNEESIKAFELNKPLYFFGDGMPKAKELLQQLPQSHFIENINTSSSSMIQLAFEKYMKNDFADVAYSEPNYLKEFFFHTAKK
ncbi:MAG: tRNA (adenosine(37)-N6)-threonylcarbamoyltransferase complex dimerization subunit type 1 TsaB [Burkholderiales bacterium]|nr:tRNA (adenosine(37)-N6)-threonylcarbamoyltransferase complex dimerization subunit type 1 TsaB [Bacteroidia bacterium]